MGRIGFARVIAFFFSAAGACSLAAELATLSTGTPREWAIQDRGQDHTLWQQVVATTNGAGRVTIQTNSYVELETSCRYWDGTAWRPSRQQIEPVRDGFVSRQSPHKAAFASALDPAMPYSVEVLTPDQQRLKFKVLGLYLCDFAADKSVLIGELKPCQGVLTSSNQVLYSDAFENITADIRYTHKKAGLEQDIILRRRSAALLPESYGFNPATTRLLCYTEVIDAPQGVRTLEQLRPGSTNDTVAKVITLGTMQIGHGSAFGTGGIGSGTRAPVQKHWLQSEGRSFIIEEVAFPDLQPILRELQAGISSMRTNESRYAITTTPRLPKALIASRSTPCAPGILAAQLVPGDSLLAAASSSEQPGAVIDYDLQSGSAVLVQGDVTYLISGVVNLTDAVLENAVLKYNPGAQLNLYSFECKTGPYRPLICTAKDDDSVGTPIPGSTHNPTEPYAQRALALHTGGTLQNLQIRYAREGIYCANNDFSITNVQFLSCDRAFQCESASFTAGNVLMSKVLTNFSGVHYYGEVEHMTADQSSILTADPEFHEMPECGGCPSSSLTLVNSLTCLVTNGYGVVPVSMQESRDIPGAAGNFQAAGAGKYYLAADSEFRGVGTPLVSPGLLAGFRNKTTCAPLVYTNITYSQDTTLARRDIRYSAGQPDLGYYYDALDYLVNEIGVSGAALTLGEGVSVGIAASGFSLGESSGIVGVGSPLLPVIISRASAVQEQSSPSGLPFGRAAFINMFSDGAEADFRFSRLYPGSGIVAGVEGESINGVLSMADSELHNGSINVYADEDEWGEGSWYVGVQNTLLWRSSLHLTDRGAGADGEESLATYLCLGFVNNLVYGGSASFSHGNQDSTWTVRDSAFDHATIGGWNATDFSYNAYISATNAPSPAQPGDQVRSSFEYARGPLGDYYQVSTGLGDSGSASAGDSGLFHYTTTLNQQREGATTVDIGLHYVAVDLATGLPADLNWDGMADHWEDANGNGIHEICEEGSEEGCEPFDFSDTDIDEDGIPNQWMCEHFGHPAGSAADFSRAQDDPDSDGLTNLQEFHAGAAGADPNQPNGPIIISQPISQAVYERDTVTFEVSAIGAEPLKYQWFLNGTAIDSETNSSLILPNIYSYQVGEYSVAVTNDLGAFVLSSSATLDITWFQNAAIPVVGARQNMTFRSGFTYLIYDYVELHGKTTIQDCVIKFDTEKDFGNFGDWAPATIVVLGSFRTEAQPFSPAILTSVRDTSVGADVYGSGVGPASSRNGVPYIDLHAVQGGYAEMNNVRFSYADKALVAPAGGGLDLWDCQFVQCGAAVVNVSNNLSIANNFHNVLLANCATVIQTSNTAVRVSGEHITSDAPEFWTGSVPPAQIHLTNSIVVGSIAPGSGLVTDHCAINPPVPMFQTNSAGSYYLTGTNPFKASGSTAISSRLLSELRGKTTQPPLAFPLFMNLEGSLTLGPRVQRYTNGAPDCGFHYNAVDFSLGWMTNRGDITVLPGTTIGFRNEFSPKHQRWTVWGVDLREGSSLTSHGTPEKPNTFVDLQLVQEQFQFPCQASFLPDFYPNDVGHGAPSLNFRFSTFYAAPGLYHVWSGYDETYEYIASPDSLLNWSMRDCKVHGGKIVLGPPDANYPPDWVYGSGEINWANNLFENVFIVLDPTWYWCNNSVINCDLSFEARNNLFGAGCVLVLGQFPATAGNWLLEDNLFDKVDFWQDPAEELDHGNNAYWPMTGAEFTLNSSEEANRLLPHNANDIVLTGPLPYQVGPLGNYYLPATTPLHGAGSRAASECGMYHYTTRVDQTKEGEELPGDVVNIGLHYVATSGPVSSQPKDTDGDGIADYVENVSGAGTVASNETDWQNQYTTSGIFDPTNSVYDDIDLDRDGLDGISERVFATSPLIQDNPLNLSTTTLPVAVSGLVQFPLNITPNLDSNTTILLNVNGYSGNTTVYKTNGNWIAEWDTVQFPNGVHRLDCEFQAGEANVAIGVTKLVTIKNDICFPDGVPLAGGTLFLQPQTIHTNGTWALQVYDDQGDLFASLDGQVDSDGYCLDPNTATQGIAFSLFDANGNMLPSMSYSAVVSTANAACGPSSSATNKISIEGPWTGNPMWVIASQPLGQFGTEVNYSVWGTMNLTAEIFKDTFGAHLLYDVDYTVSGSITWRLTTNQKWGQLALRLGLFSNATQARNFFYFGHFDGENLGGTTNKAYSISISDIRNALGNAADPLKGPNKHPFRFVFIDGCNSADSDLCTAFGIPRKQMTSQQMRDKGLEPRAFVGWKTVKLTNLGGVFNHAHLAFVERFWELWPMTNPDTGRPYTLQEALDQAHREKAPPFFTKPTIYGCPDLTYR